MTLDSTASLKGIVSSVGDKFQVGTAFLPKPQGAKDGGVIVGGASLYILNNRPEAEQKAAWEFIKYLVAPEQQAYWHINSGYFPITKKAYDQPSVKENMTKYPQFKTAVDQLHSTKLNKATQGAVMAYSRKQDKSRRRRWKRRSTARNSLKRHSTPQPRKLLAKSRLTTKPSSNNCQSSCTDFPRLSPCNSKEQRRPPLLFVCIFAILYVDRMPQSHVSRFHHDLSQCRVSMDGHRNVFHRSAISIARPNSAMRLDASCPTI